MAVTKNEVLNAASNRVLDLVDLMETVIDCRLRWYYSGRTVIVDFTDLGLDAHDPEINQIVEEIQRRYSDWDIKVRSARNYSYRRLYSHWFEFS